MFVLTCDKTGRHWRHVTEGLARRAALHLGLKDYTITAAPSALNATAAAVMVLALMAGLPAPAQAALPSQASATVDLSTPTPMPRPASLCDLHPLCERAAK